MPPTGWDVRRRRAILYVGCSVRFVRNRPRRRGGGFFSRLIAVTVVESDVRLKAAHFALELCGAPFFALEIPIGKIDNEVVNTPIVCAQFQHLPVQVGDIPAPVGAGIARRGIRFSAEGMLTVVGGRVIRVVPIHEGVIKPQFQSLGAHRIHPFANKVSSRWAIGGLVFGEGGIKEAKSIVVFGGQQGVAGAREFGQAGPLDRPSGIRVESFETAPILIEGQLLRRLQPFSPGGHRINTKVQGESKAVVLPSGKSFFRRGGSVHRRWLG